MSDVANAFGANAFDIEDDPRKIWEKLTPDLLKKPCLFNIKTNRLFWHGGAGTDDPNGFDRHKEFTKLYGDQLNIDNKNIVDEMWENCKKLV